MIVHFYSSDIICCTFWADLKFIDLMASLICGVWVHAFALHSLLVLSEIVPILGTSIMFQIQFTNLPLCSLDRYTPKVFSAYKSVHAAILTLPSLDTCCTWGTETTWCEKRQLVDSKPYLFPSFTFTLLLGRAS